MIHHGKTDLLSHSKPHVNNTHEEAAISVQSEVYTV